MKTRKGLALSTSKGFTLIELLIVIAIIAILAIIVVLNLSNARDKANYARAKSDIKSVSDAFKLSIAEGKITNSTWVAAQGTLAVPVALSAVTTPTLLVALKDGEGASLLSVLPVAPTGFAYQAAIPVNPVTAAWYFVVDTPKTANCVFNQGNVVLDTNCRP